MTLVKYQNQMPNIFDKFFSNELEDWNKKHFSKSNTTLPAVNIKEDLNNYSVEVAVPGFEKKDFNIELNNDLLTISSEKQTESKKEDEQITRQEFSYQSFSRTFTLPELVESDKITAKYKNGILSIVIPKKEEAKPKPIKQIKIA